MRLLIATSNPNKLREIRPLLSNLPLEIVTLADISPIPEPQETHATFWENARQKAFAYADASGLMVVAEDSGLEIAALNGEPGVKSARYAGDEKSFDRNIEKLLTKLGNETNRAARFKTIISLVVDGKEHLFEGLCDGRIIFERRGNQGFGYDPVFVPDGADHTFGEMSLKEKTIFSHRKKATEKLVTFLNQLV